MPKPVLNMSIDELKEEDVPQSSLNFGQVKVAKSRKVFFNFDPIQVGLVGLVGLVGSFGRTITVSL